MCFHSSVLCAHRSCWHFTWFLFFGITCNIHYVSVLPIILGVQSRSQIEKWTHLDLLPLGKTMIWKVPFFKSPPFLLQSHMFAIKFMKRQKCLQCFGLLNCHGHYYCTCTLIVLPILLNVLNLLISNLLTLESFCYLLFKYECIGLKTI